MTSRDASPRLQIDAFRKILKLEESRGYEDRAVIGGLDRFLQRQSQVIRDIAGDGDLSRLLSITYCSMTPRQRQKWISRWLARLEADDRKVEGRSVPPAATDAGVSLGNEVYHTPPALAESRPANLQRSPSPKQVPVVPSPDMDAPVDRLKGVDTKISAKLGRLGVSTIRDLLYLFPRRHNDFTKVAKISELVPGEEQTTVATVWEARETTLGRGKLKATEAVVGDETGNIRVIWFGQRYMARVLKPNSMVAISGQVEMFKGQKQFKSPEFEILDRQETMIHTSRLVPVYPLTEGLTPRRLRSIIWQALELWVPRIGESLPDDIKDRVGLVPLAQAVMQAHYPDDLPSLESARKRLAFDEFFLLQMAVLMRRKSWQDTLEGIPIQADSKAMGSFLSSLPFNLTAAQERCIEEILADIKRGTPPMNRLLQGEVGSGKTVVALTALLATAMCGYQGSIMVPTELLAEQHFATVTRLLEGLARPVQEDNLITVYLEPFDKPISVGLLTGSTRGAIKKELQRRLSEGNLDLIIGTHALVQEGVEIPRLALAVVDEQHRFGVMQRAALRQKGAKGPHVLVMSATPIPRTLTLTLYGDLDISTLDQLPPGRQQVRTRLVPPERRDAAYGFVRKEIRDGRQGFVIYPLIEESEVVEARAATEEYERLSREVFPDLRLGLLHGRMPARDKEDVMRRFRDGELDILVSTAVVEVGIDVPNATVMMVEGAHRFGLAQLHQFRGRVGRGEHQSYCLLVSEYSSAEAMERLSAVERIHDGFQLAEVDLSMRGPGTFSGLARAVCLPCV